MSTKYYRREDGTFILEIPEDETASLMTQAELARVAGRSPEFVKGRREAGIIAPIAVTGSGIELYSPYALPPLARSTIYRGGQMVEAASLNGAQENT